MACMQDQKGNHHLQTNLSPMPLACLAPPGNTWPLRAARTHLEFPPTALLAVAGPAPMPPPNGLGSSTLAAL